jgi:hypothetical protein
MEKGVTEKAVLENNEGTVARRTAAEEVVDS